VNTVVLCLSVRRKYVFFIKLGTMSHFFLFLSNFAENFSFGISQNSLERVLFVYGGCGPW
jgi:hypothetical protein